MLQGREIMVTKTLKLIEELLPSSVFVRIHKSTLVNLNYITSYNRTNGYTITLNNGKQLDVAYRKNEKFIATILKKQKPVDEV